MKVTLVATTQVRVKGMRDAVPDYIPQMLAHPTDTQIGESGELSEFAGRACYQSWDRPNPATATNAGYLDHIIKVNHGSVLEHGSVTFYIEGVSRSLTHELVRHRHFSYSQLSQRFVVLSPNVSTDDFVVPPLFEGDEIAANILMNAWECAVKAYELLLEHAYQVLRQQGVKVGARAKRAREAARCVLPNMTPTAIVVTGNHRAWREFLEKRGTFHADAEIRALAGEIYKILFDYEPTIYQDFRVTEEGEVLREQR